MCRTRSRVYLPAARQVGGWVQSHTTQGLWSPYPIPVDGAVDPGDRQQAATSAIDVVAVAFRRGQQLTEDVEGLVCWRGQSVGA